MSASGVTCTAGTGRLGRLACETQRLAPEIETIAGFRTEPCFGGGAGAWCNGSLWKSEMASLAAAESGLAAKVPRLMEAIHETFRIDAIKRLQIFSIKGRGFVLPHRDWILSAPRYTRLHIPLRTNSQCLHAEEDSVFHMPEGEVWVLDASLTHGAASFSDASRIHVVMDFDPEVAVHDLFCVPGNCASTPAENIDRAKLTPDDLDAVYGLAEIASPRNFQRIAEMLATLHYDRQVNCAAMYDWLGEIARRSGEARLVDLAGILRRRYLGPADSPRS